MVIAPFFSFALMFEGTGVPEWQHLLLRDGFSAT